ncbi:MAG: PKD domain-containing protein, partial [Planctomycetota bacterium]
MATFTASFRLRTPPVTGIARVAMGLALAGCSAWPPLPLDEGAVPPTLNATVVQEGDPGTLDSPKSESVSAAPKLAVSAGPVFCCNPFTVAFSVAAENVDASEVGTYRWEFGDGRSGEGADVEHTYPRPGVYTVMVTVQTASGQLIAGEHTLLLEWNDGVVDVVLDPPAGSLSSGTDSSPSDPTETVRPPDGGGGVVEPVDQPSLTLVVDAGPDLTVTAGERVRLDAGASRIPQDVPPTYTWSEISGFGIELIDGGTASPAFDAPAGLTDPIVLTFRLQIAAGTLEGADTVNVTVVPLEMPQVPAGGEPGYPMVFLDGPSENDPPGTYVVRWRFPGLSAPPADVRLIRDCCGCEDYESEPLFPDADGVYETTVEIPEDPSVWYQVEYTHGGIRYTSQSVYVNVPAGPASPPPMVIWYHYP